MRPLLIVLFASCLCADAKEAHAARAYHQQDWMTWANKTGLAIETIQRLWRTVLSNDSEDHFGESIETVDATTLRVRKHILFVVAGGNGHCLSLYVFGKGGDDTKPLWTLKRLPDDEGGICHEQLLHYPTAYVKPTGDIVVQVPTAPAWVKREEPLGDYPVSTALMIYTYRWNGSTYTLSSRKLVPTYQSTSFSPEKCPAEAPCP